MAFRITARTLLELGAELIGSDAVAVFELVKNAVDARSPLVRITIQAVLAHSRFLHVLEQIDGDVPFETIRETIAASLSSDAPVDAKRQLTSLLNDAGEDRAKLRTAFVRAYRDLNFIEISDDGDGMSLNDLVTIYLTIGTRSRRQQKDTWEKEQQEPTQPLLGDKGLGRLSVMRLGDEVTITTSRAGEPYWNVLEIDWTRFSHDSDALLEEIPITPRHGPRKKDRAASGTTIRVHHLKSDWSREKFVDLLKIEFARMVDPFERRRGNRLFRIAYNGEQETIPQIAARLFDAAHAVVKCSFTYDASGHARLVGEMHYRLHADRRDVVVRDEVELLSITDSKAVTVLRTLGPFDVEFLWFNRKHLEAFAGLGTRQDVIDLVKQWAGGLMVFRDGFRIYPYGGPDDDWLELDKKAFGRSGYKLNRQQVVGRVRLTWRSRHLIEQTNREGLVDNDHKLALKSILVWLLEHFKTFSQQIQDEQRREDLTSLDLLKQRVLEAKTDVQKRIRQIAVEAPAQARPLREVERLVQQLAAQIDGVDEIIDDYKDDRRKFVHLAGLGLMVELILHELARATGNTLGTLENIDPSGLPGQVPAVFATLEAQLKTLQKRIQTLDPLSTARRQIKETFSIREVLEQIVEARADQARRHKVDVRIELAIGAGWRIKAVKGMLIQVVENLLANSFYWLKQQRILHPSFRGRVTIAIDQRAKTIAVTDNGPGVAASRAEEIFQPFVTSKPPGRGSGLGLYIARELCAYHGWTLQLVGNRRRGETMLHTFVLDLGDSKR